MAAFTNDLRWIKDNGLMRETWIWVGVAVLLRYFVACFVPLANDEAYYWDWGRDLQLSYFDHPPFVSWLAWIGQTITPEFWSTNPISARAAIPLCHAIATVGLIALTGNIAKAKISSGQAKQVLRRLMVLTQMTPVITLGGFLLMPDVGLLVFVTFAAWYIVTQLTSDLGNPLSTKNGLVLGALCGLAGLSKYHAAVLCGGLVLALFIKRISIFKRELPFWITLVATGLATCTPVWLWNYRNDMASFAFQTSHGFGGLDFNPIFSLQLLVSLIVFFSPYVFFSLLNSFKSKSYILLGGALPLFIIIVILSPFKQILPHWIVPSFWLLIPIAATQSPKWPRLWNANALFALLFVTVICAAVGSKNLRRAVIKASNNKPGGLGEMTVWQPLVDDIRIKELAKTATRLAASDPDKCPKPFAWASMRWYSVAQLAFALPGQPRVYSVETDRYYYHYRSNLSDLAGCTMLVLGETGHYNKAWFEKNAYIFAKGEITVLGHEDRPFTWNIGKLSL